MGKIKTYFIYIIIIVLCIAAFLGSISKKAGTGNFPPNQRSNEQSTDEKENHIEAVMKNAAAELEAEPIIGIGLGNDYEAVAAAAIENAGGLMELIKQGDTVLIKPNICTIAGPGSAVITDYRVVQKTADLVREYGASRVIVAEGAINGNSFDEMSLKINRYGELKGVDLININDIEKKDCYELKPEKSTTGKAFFIPKVYMDADVVISISKLKTHSQAVVSLSLKNSFGIPSAKVYGASGYKGGLHALGMEKAIVDLNLIRRPDLSIIEGIVGGEGYGPIDNTQVKSNIIFAGKDQVALDTVALSFMGFNVSQIPHVKLAAELKMGVSDIDRIKIIGADLNSIKMNFKSEYKK